MIEQLFESKEKKVEYIELIYDLIFVYIIGRNNALLHIFENGFVAWPAFFAYVLTTLAVIQIWNYSTYYINIYGRHSVREHVFLFVNMFLLYFIGEGTRVDWQGFHTQYHVAWALILINIGVQYLIELRHHEERGNQKQIIRMAVILLVEAMIVLADIPLYQATQTTWLSLIAIVFGVAAVLILFRLVVVSEKDGAVRVVITLNLIQVDLVSDEIPQFAVSVFLIGKIAGRGVCIIQIRLVEPVPDDLRSGAVPARLSGQPFGSSLQPPVDPVIAVHAVLFIKIPAVHRITDKYGNQHRRAFDAVA